MLLRSFLIFLVPTEEKHKVVEKNPVWMRRQKIFITGRKTDVQPLGERGIATRGSCCKVKPWEQGGKGLLLQLLGNRTHNEQYLNYWKRIKPTFYLKLHHYHWMEMFFILLVRMDWVTEPDVLFNKIYYCNRHTVIFSGGNKTKTEMDNPLGSSSIKDSLKWGKHVQPH